MKNEVALVSAYAALLLVLCVAGALVPGGLNWGFHFLGFFPLPYLFAFVILGTAMIVLGTSGIGENLMRSCGSLLARHPWIVLLSALAVFSLAAVAFRIAVPLLGDSYLIVNNYQNTLRGEHSLNTYSEPLAMFYFFGLLKLFGATSQADIFRVFFVGDLLLGLGFVVNVFLIARKLVVEPVAQFLFFGFLTCTSSLQLFFGYIESYPVVLYCLSLFVLTVAHYQGGTVAFFVVVVAYLLQLAVHFLNLLLLPVVLLLTYSELRERGGKGLLVAAGVTGAAVCSTVIFFGANLERFLPRFSHAHYLSVSGAGDEFQAYTLVSMFHFVDLANLALLVMPFSLLFLAIAILTGGMQALTARGTLGFTLASAGVLGFLSVVKYDLGTAKDWDIAATFSFPLSVLVGKTLLQTPSSQRIRAFFIAVAVSLLTAVPFFFLNATVEPNIARFRSLLDERVMSRESLYLALNHLSKYYYTLRDQERVNELWVQYTAKYPADWRGYRGLVKSLIQLGDADDRRIRETFAKWIAADPGKTTMRDDFLQYCFAMSQRCFTRGDAPGALYFNREAVAFDSTVAPAWNNIGLALRAGGNPREAVEAYNRALAIDPRYVAALINLGNVYDDLGNTAEAISWYERSLALDPNAPGAYFNLGIAHLKMHNTAAAVIALQQAARLGEVEAQILLRQRGVSW